MIIKGHHIEEKQCTRCLRSLTECKRCNHGCPGMPWYSYGASRGLYSQRQLRAKGLRLSKGQQPQGCTITPGYGTKVRSTS